MINKQTLSSLLALSTALVVSAAAWGLDTDVYLKPPSVYRNDAPNILIILDNSGSMSSNYITTRVPYDPTVTYTGSFDNTKLYWSTNGRPPSSSTTQWIFAANNHCQASLAALGSTAGAGGFFNSISTVGWIWDTTGSGGSTVTSSTTGHWGNLQPSTSTSRNTNRDGNYKMKDVECVEDNPAEPGFTALNNQTNLAYTSRYVSGSANNLAFTGYSAATFYSANYLNWYNDPTLSTTQSRWQIAQSAVNRIVDANPGVNLGLMVFNTDNTLPDGGRVISHIQSMSSSTARNFIKTTVNGMTANTYTPLAETMWEAYRYLSGQSVTFGNPTGMTPAADLCAQDNVNSPCTQTGTYVTPFSQACQKSYIILVTDGDPTNDSAANTSINGLLSGTGITVNANGSLMDELTEYMYTHDLITSLPGNQVVVTYTVGFGSGISAAGLQLLQDTARRGGNAGKMPNQGYYTANDDVELTNAIQSAIVDALQVTTSFTAPALSVNSFNNLYNRNDVYYAMFKPSTTARWNGNVKKYTLCSDTSASPTCTFGTILDANLVPAIDPTSKDIKDTATSFWSATVDGKQVDKGGAGAQVPTYTSRKIYTYTGAYDADNLQPVGGPADLTSATNAVTTTNSAITQAMLGVSTSTDRDNLINWIRGQDVYDENLNTVTAEDRGWKFYDPAHSRPAVVSFGGTTTNPVLKIFVGTNDGLLRMINEKTGVEEWAFLPQELLGQQQTIADNAEGAHIWGVDGTPSFEIKDYSKDSSGNIVPVPDGVIDPSIGDYVHVFFGLRRGGNNVYALDVTPTTALSNPSATGGINPKLMWVIHGGNSTGYAALSQTWSQPISRTLSMGTGVGTGAAAKSKFARGLFFAGGYDPVNDMNIPAPTTTLGNAIYIADPNTGKLIFWISSSTSTADLKLAGMNYSIPSDLTVVDTNGDGAVDRIYVGDVAGQIWRIDLSPTLMPGAGNGSNGHVLADLGCTSGSRPSCTGTPDQERRRFFYPPAFTQVLDTMYGSPTDPKYDIVAIGSGDREDPLDYLTQNKSETPVHNRLYVLRDYDINALTTGATMTYQATIKDANLYNASSGSLLNATTATIAASGIQSQMGWYVNFVDGTGAWVGEKCLAKVSILQGTVTADTFTPASTATATQTCSANAGLASQRNLNVLDGQASVDVNGDGVIDNNDRVTNVGSGIPPEQVVVFLPGGQVLLTGTNAKRGSTGNAAKKGFWYQ